MAKTSVLKEKNMLSSLELKILKHYHANLETIDECFPLIQPDNFDWDKSSEALRLMISIEINSLTHIEKAHIKEIFIDRIDTVHQYLTERIGSTKNSLLRAKYYNLLFCLTNNNKEAVHAIENYKSALDTCLGNKLDQNRHIKFQEILDVIIQLSIKLKYNIEELKEQIHYYLKSAEIYDRMKTWIIISISKSNLFRIKELYYIPELCCKLSQKETEYRFVEINLKLGLEISIKLQDTEKQKIIYELLGDNEYKQLREYDGEAENIIVPHINSNTLIKIIQFYKNAKNDTKRDKAILEYNANKKLCKFFKITSRSEANNSVELQKLINELFFAIVSSPTKHILAELISGNNLLFIPHQLLNKYKLERKEKEPSLFRSVIHDLNNNQREIDNVEHFAYTIYSICLSRTISFATDIIIHSLMEKKLSYKKTERLLSGASFFGQELIITRNGYDHSYNWFEMIDVGLKEFFKQCDLFIKNRKPDWRFSVDFLTLKFEGILRDIIGLMGGKITKFDNRGNSTDLLLDDLLRSESLEKVFSIDDIYFFQYVFTNKGDNIRNNVAHSFYKPNDYTMNKAVVVFLCIMRLAKFNLENKANQDSLNIQNI